MKRLCVKSLLIAIIVLFSMAFGGLALFLFGKGGRGKSPEVAVHLQRISASGLTFFIENKENTPIFYGADYGLSRKEADRWTEVPTLSGDPVMACSILYTLDENAKGERMTVAWNSDYGQLSPGIYRFSKWVSTDEAGEENYSVGAEFEVPGDA